MKLGDARDQSRTAWRLVIIEVAADSAIFSYRLDRNKLRQARSREGRYLLRTNLVEGDPAKLWSYICCWSQSRRRSRISRATSRSGQSFTSSRHVLRRTSSSPSWPKLAGGSERAKGGMHTVFWRDGTTIYCSMTRPSSSYLQLGRPMFNVKSRNRPSPRMFTTLPVFELDVHLEIVENHHGAEWSRVSSDQKAVITPGDRSRYQWAAGAGGGGAGAIGPNLGRMRPQWVSSSRINSARRRSRRNSAGHARCEFGRDLREHPRPPLQAPGRRLCTSSTRCSTATCRPSSRLSAS